MSKLNLIRKNSVLNMERKLQSDKYEDQNSESDEYDIRTPYFDECR